MLVAQQSRFDPTRAPAGHHTLWAYCHVPNGSTVDMTERIEAQIERFAPGFRDVVLARTALSPADFEARNANKVGGDIGGGSLAGLQFVPRPATSRSIRIASPTASISARPRHRPGRVSTACPAAAVQRALRRRAARLSGSSAASLRAPGSRTDNEGVGVQHVETTTGPVAVGGRTINLVARTTSLTLGPSRRALGTWSRPVHVEILDADGRRQIVPVRDYQLVTGIALVAVTVAGLAGRAALAWSRA